MPEKLPAGVEISISRRSLPSDYKMPTMDMSTDHYSVGFLVSGDRRTITAQQSYDAHAGDVSMMPPYVYHRTVSLSTAPYESFLVKFSPRAAEPLVALMGPAYLSELMEQKIHHFSSMIQVKLLALFEDMVAVYSSGAPYSSLIPRRRFSAGAMIPAVARIITRITKPRLSIMAISVVRS